VTGFSPEHSVASRAAERWFREALLGGDFSIAHEVFTSDVALHSARGDVVGLPAMQALAMELRALDDLNGEMNLASDGDQIAGTIVVRGRHARPLWGAAATGRAIEARAIVSIRTEAGKLAEIWKTCVVQQLDGTTAGSALAAPTLERWWARRWGLTPREALVAELAMRGHADKEIAQELRLATTSVSKYLRSVLRKAGVVSRGALAERARVIVLG
jgi:DNA-binding CsgD family transcriptional regulator